MQSFFIKIKNELTALKIKIVSGHNYTQEYSKNYFFLCQQIFSNAIYFCDGNAEFSPVINPVFSVI